MAWRTHSAFVRTCISLLTATVPIAALDFAVADDLTWFEPVNGAFIETGKWLTPEGTVSPITRNPNPTNRRPGAGDAVIFRRDNFGIGAAYEVTIDDASVASFGATGSGVIALTLQPLTFNVRQTLTAGRFSLSGKIILKGQGQIIGNGSENSFNDVTVTDKTKVRLNVLSESSGLTVEEGSAFRASRLVNLGGGLVLRGTSSLNADSALLNGGIETFPSPDLSDNSTFDTVDLELIQGWMRVRSAAKLHTGTAKLGTPEGTGATIFVTGPGSEWIATNAVERANVKITDNGFANLMPTLASLSAHVENTGSKLEFEEAQGNVNLRVWSGATASGKALSLTNLSGSVAGDDSMLKVADVLAVEGRANFLVSEAGLMECTYARLLTVDPAETISMTVAGTESSWRVRESLLLASKAGGFLGPNRATLDIRQGGTVSVGPDSGVSAHSATLGPGSTIRVSDANSVFDARSVTMTVADPSFGAVGAAEISVLRSGRVLARKLLLGPGGLVEARAAVSGAGSRLEVSESIVLGDSGESKGTLILTNGGAASALRTAIGNSFRSNTVVITGAGSSLAVSDKVYIGHLGNGSILIENGGKLLPGSSGSPREIGLGVMGGSKGVLTVNGDSSSVEFPNDPLTVGFRGDGSLIVSGGALVRIKDCALGWETTSSAAALITGKPATGRESRLFAERLRVGGTPATSAPAILDVNDSGSVQVDKTLEILEQGTVRLNSAGSILIGSGLEGPDECVVGVGGTLVHDGTLVAKRVRNGGTILGRFASTTNPGSLAFTPGRSASVGLAASASPPHPDRPNPPSIEGELSMEGSATTIIEIAGAANPQRSALRVTGAVALGGKLVLQFTGGFAPVAGQVFRLFDFRSTVSGQFTQIEIVGLAPGFQYDFARDAAGAYVLTALADGVATSPPPLSVQRSGASLIIAWPETATGYTLQRTSDLGLTDWQPLPTTPHRMVVPVTGTTEFFRLIRP